MSYNHSANSVSERAREQGQFSDALPGIFGFSIMAFSPFVQVKHHSTDPFKTQKGIMLTFVVAILLYVVAWAFQIQLRSQDSSHYKIISKVCLLSGALATISPVLIVIPFLGWFLLVLWAFCFARVAYDSYQDFYQLLNHANLNNVFDILNKLITIRLRRMTEEEPNQLPPNRLPV